MLSPIAAISAFFALFSALESAPALPRAAPHTACQFVARRAINLDDPFRLPSGEQVWFWSPERLTWHDYEGKPAFELVDIAALTSSGIVSWKGCKEGKIDFEVRAYFDKLQSWVKPEAYTDYHLAHEQGHFDITEIYARRLDIALKQRAFTCGEEDAFEDFINTFLEQWQRAEKQYDLDCAFSMRPREQGIWLRKINTELSRSSIYAHTQPFED